MKKRILSLLLCLVMLCCLLPTFAFAEAEEVAALKVIVNLPEFNESVKTNCFILEPSQVGAASVSCTFNGAAVDGGSAINKEGSGTFTVIVNDKAGVNFFTADTAVVVYNKGENFPPIPSTKTFTPGGDGTNSIKIEIPFTVTDPSLCTVSFDANGGTGTMASVRTEKNKEYTLPACGFTAPTGKTFCGWMAGSDYKEPGEKITPVGDVTFKAVYSESKSLTYVVTPGAKFYNNNMCWFPNYFSGKTVNRVKMGTASGDNLGLTFSSDINAAQVSGTVSGIGTRTVPYSLVFTDGTACQLTISVDSKAAGETNVRVETEYVGIATEKKFYSDEFFPGKTTYTKMTADNNLSDFGLRAVGSGDQDARTFNGYDGTPTAKGTCTANYYVVGDGTPYKLAVTINIKDSFTVTYDANGHGTAPAAEKVGDGQKATEPAAPTAEGYKFGGWYTDKDGTAAFSFNTPITEDITLYAKWLEPHTVSFDANGHGAAPKAETVYDGEKANEPKAPTAAGYSFGGWCTDKDLTAKFDFDTPITADTVLYAKWNQNYRITKGDGSWWLITSKSNLDFTCNGPFEYFSELLIDGSPVDPSCYTAKSGSTKVSLLKAYLKTLSVGTHKIQFVYDVDGETVYSNEGRFSVCKVPPTGDGFNGPLFTTLLILSGTGLAAITIFRRKKKHE